VLGPRTVGLQLERIIRGFFKVNVLAMLLHALQEDALAQMVPSYPCRSDSGPHSGWPSSIRSFSMAISPATSTL